MVMETPQGDENARRLESWVNDYSSELLRVCFVYLRDLQQAEDALQDTFIKAWRSMDRRSAEGFSEKAWLTRIAVNTCHDYHRSKWFRHTDMRRALDELPQTPAAQAGDRELFMDVCALPEKEKQAALLYYYQQMTLSETAKILGISKSAVFKRLSGAQKKLRIGFDGREQYEE